MNFSKFLNILYDNTHKKVRNKKKFVVDLFESNGVTFFGGESKAQKLISEGPTKRYIDSVLREDYKDKCNIEAIKNFLLENINNIKIHDLLSSFDIPKDEKKDFDILLEAIAIQFKNYIKYNEDKMNTTVCSIYLSLLDEYGNGKNPCANRDAVFAAKQVFYSAVQCIAKLNPIDEILNLKGPFENFFKGCHDTFKTFENKCNKEGKNLYKKVKQEVINLTIPNMKGTKSTDEYLDLITETGSLPLNIVKELHFIIYDNYSLEDKTTTLTINLFDDFTIDKTIDALSQINFDEINEVYFTEYIIFRLEGENNNLLNDIIYITTKIDIILNYLENCFDKHPKMNVLNKKFDDLYNNLSLNSIRYLSDGTFFPNEKTIRYDPSIEPILYRDDGSSFTPGDEKININQIPLFIDIPNNNLSRFKTLFMLNFNLLKNSKKKEMMTKLLTINEDGTGRFFMFPTTGKAKIYRKIREISNLVFDDKIKDFIFIEIFVSYPAEKIDEIIKLKDHEREKLGTDILVSYAYLDEKFYMMNSKFEQSIENLKIHKTHTLPSFLWPLIKKIKVCKILNEKNNS